MVNVPLRMCHVPVCCVLLVERRELEKTSQMRVYGASEGLSW